MSAQRWPLRSRLAICAVVAAPRVSSTEPVPSPPPLPITAVVADAAGGRVAVLLPAEAAVALLDAASHRVVRRMPVPGGTAAIALRGDGLWIAVGAPAGRVVEMDAATGAIRREWRAGHTPPAIAISPDGRRLAAANRFDATIDLFDIATGGRRTVSAIREPVALAFSDNDTLWAANLLPEVRPQLSEEHPTIAAELSVVDAAGGRILPAIALPNGSHSLRGLAVSPDGRFLAVPHVVSLYKTPTWTLDRGAMNRNAVTIIDAPGRRRLMTVGLDDPDLGAANPWAVAFSADGRFLLVAHAGAHELSVIEWPALQRRALECAGSDDVGDAATPGAVSDIRRRVRLPLRGPRAMAEAGGRLFVAGAFSGNLVVLDASDPARLLGEALPAPPGWKAGLASRGEELFHDATLCRQGWQSCASCHPDGRSDALYWDLLNDGVGNTKNTKSLVLSAHTPPVMWRGVRGDAAAAIRAGIRHIQFAEVAPEHETAIEAWLRALRPIPSPTLDPSKTPRIAARDPSCAACHDPAAPRGGLSDAARRGKTLFRGKAGCVECHPPPWFTICESRDPGLGAGIEYDVPTLVEAWRTAPYLHDGAALTLREAIVDFNTLQKRGRTRDLTEAEIDDLVEYVRSL